MPSAHRGTREYSLIYAELIAAARHRGTVRYQELADLIGLPLRGGYMAGELGEYLGAISEDEVNQGRPMLSAVTVNKDGKPSRGFFGLAKQLGKLASDDPVEQEAFWESEKKAVYKTWQRTFTQASQHERNGG
jgi:hypothetical protein